MTTENVRFHIADYIVMILFLIISSVIGIYFGFFKKQRTMDEYLLGGRRMHLVPVAMSLVVTYASAISVIGVPMEIYVYDTMTNYFWLSICAADVIQAYMIVPLVHPLRLTSAYEYFGRRFKSRSVQLLCAALGMLQTLLYMSIVLLAPALALEAVAGIPLWLSIVVIGAIGTIYTSIGGMKTVIWTDVFQFIMLYGGLVVILIIGIHKVGGMKNMFEVAYEGGRVNFSSISPDPRVRHTVWGLTIGGVFSWLPNCCNQSTVQRISSMRSARDAKISSLLNVPLRLIYGFILTLAGLLMYSYFAIQECDPYIAGNISNRNQLVPYFVMHEFWKIPGLSGIFIAALFSGALSSLSSGINALSANTLQDILVNVLEDATQVKKTLVAKLIVVVYGVLVVGLAYLARVIPGPVTQIAQTAFGAVGGPMVGIFCLGAMFPQANWIGALVGGLVGIVMNMWVAIGSFLYGAKAPISPTISTNGCNGTYIPSAPSLESLNGTIYSTDITQSFITTTDPVSVTSGHLAIYDISYIYFGLLGFLVTFVVGIIISILTVKFHSVTATFQFYCGRRPYNPDPRCTWNIRTTPLSVTSGHLAIYDIYYMFFGLLGFLVTFIVGIIISILTGKNRGDPTKSEYIFSCMRQFWRAEYDAVSVPQIQMVAKSKVEPVDVDNGFSSKHLADVNSVEMSLSNNQHEGQL